MRRHEHLWGQVCSFDNLLLAAHRAESGKRFRHTTLAFNRFREEELLCLKEELSAHIYRPAPHTHFTIYEPKERLISAPDYRDRVVHHALCNVIEPLLERAFIYDTYACRVGKGTHRALDRCQHFLRGHAFVLKCDIWKYFPSVDHRILNDLLSRSIGDGDVLWLIRLIVEQSDVPAGPTEYFPGDDLVTPYGRQRGLPIGSLTSQLFANIYLNPLDHFVKESLQEHAYLRYMDDFLVLSNSKARLHEIRKALDERVTRLRLRLHPRKTVLFATKSGLPFLGFHVGRERRRLLRSGIRRFVRRTKRLQRGVHQRERGLDSLQRSVMAWRGHACHGDTSGLVRRLFADLGLPPDWCF